LIFEPDASVYPYNSGMAGPVHLPGGSLDANYSRFMAFLAGVDNATAILDFGLDEEGTGGANAGNDLYIYFKSGTDLSHLQYDFWFSISQDGTDWELISHDNFNPLLSIVGVDVDDALSRRKWDWFRYVKIMVNNSGFYDVNGIELVNVWNTLVDALSVTIGPLRMDSELYLNGDAEQEKILVGSVTGEFNAIAWNETSGQYEVWWDSGDDDFYTFGENIWDMEYIGGQNSETPIWLKMKELWMPPDAGLEYNDWTWGILDPYNGIYGSSTPIYLMGTDFYQIRAYTDYGELDPVVNGYLFPINDYVDSLYEQTTVTVVDLKTDYNSNPMIVVGGFNPGWPIDGIGGLRGGLYFFYRANYWSQFLSKKSIYDIDSTGEIAQLVSAAKAAPRTDFADVDSDGDLDMILSLGYVYLCRNNFMETGVANFTLVYDYFDAINSKETSKVWGRPEMFDIDDDGDLDLILSYHNSMGATCWLNEGTDIVPIWEEDKRLFSNPDLETNMKYQNLTAVQIIPHGYGFHLEDYYNYLGEPIPGEFSMVAYNTWTERLWWSIAAYDASDSYVVATYPKAAQMDFSLLEPEAPYFNIGYHIHETWSNEFDLEDWTLSITSGDIDNDGMGEIIVGDYDNNVYAFEHLGNNTYKRMYRSFDLNHTEVTDVSPYLYEELEGISGDFNRKIWDHAEHLVADVDLDQDGLKEIVVSSGLQLYIFEDKGLFGGDELIFVYSIDLRETEWYESASLVKYTITAIAAGADLDYDGRNELAVAAGAYVFLFNVPLGSFEGMEDNDYFATDLSLGGRYFLIGNPGGALGFSRAQINAMTLCDTDKDGYRELIIGGIANDRLKYKHGFLYVYECQGGTFYKAWEAPEEVWYWNPITDVALDDQDYDGNWEIIIGHTNGFDMWEHIPGTDSEYQKVEHVTANPNYPIIPLSSTLYPALESYSIGTYGHFQKDVVRMSGIYENISYTVYENGNKVWLKGYGIAADFWTPGVPMTNYISYQGVTVTYEWAPTITEATIANTWQNDLYFAWEVRDASTLHYICVVWYDVSADTWSSPYLLQDTGGISWVNRYSPSVFEYSDTHIGVAYMYDSAVEGSGNVGIRIMAKDFSGFLTAAPFDFQGEEEFIVHDVSAARLWDGTVAIAMSAINAFTAKLDYDVWVVVGNDQNNFTLSVPHQATTSYHEDMFVDIEYLRSPDHSLVIVYEQVDALPEERLMMVASTTKGRIWNVPEALNYIPDYVDRFEGATGGLYYINTTSGLLLWSVNAYAPAVMPLREAGFMYLSTFTASSIFVVTLADRQVQLLLPAPDLLYGFNLQSDWTGNWLRDVVDLDVGDTDSDGRREVVVGFDDHVGVYEMKHSNNGTDFMSYEEAWLSDPYENDVTGVTVSDSNSNGWDDIGISTKRGNVYFIEYLDPSEGALELWYSEQSWSYPSANDMTYMAWNDLMDSYDIDSDGYDEVIAAHTGANQVIALRDDGTIMWEFTDSADSFNALLLSDLNNDTIPEVLAPCNDTTLYVLDITNGNLLWKYDDPTSELIAVTTGDIFGDGLPEVVVTDYNGDVWILNSTGALMNYEDVATVPLLHPMIGNFTDDLQPQIAFVGQDTLFFGTLYVMNPLNGSIYYSTYGASTTCNLLASDFNEDGFEDIVFTSLWMHILDVNSSTIFYNSSYKGFTNGMFMDDFDGDNVVEILVGSFYSGVYLEEVYSGVTQWHYDLTQAWDVNRIVALWDMDTGNIGGSGPRDVVLAGGLYERLPIQTSLDTGVVIALDGKNGVPKWFNYSDGVYTEVVAAYLPYGLNDSIVAWDFVNDDIVASHGVEPIKATIPEAFPIHDVYWSQDVSLIRWTYTHDLNGDGIDEIIVVQKYGRINMWDPVQGIMVWNRTMGGEIDQVKFGKIDGSGYIDVLVQYDNAHVEVLEGSDGQSIQRYNQAGNYKTVDFLVADFDQSAANPNEEVAVLYHEFSGTYNTYIQWYDETAVNLYQSQITWADPSSNNFYMDYGFMYGNPVPEVAVAGQNIGAAYIFQGNGLWVTAIGLGPDPCAGLEIGYLFTMSNEVIVWIDTDDDIQCIDHIGGGSSTLNHMTDYVRSFHLVNINQTDSQDELLVNTKTKGVIGYDYYLNVDWTYEAPLVIDDKSAWSIFKDVNDDGQIDLVFTNYDYINVVDGSNGRLIWHYKNPDMLRIVYPSVGAFYEAYQMDVVYLASGAMHLVAHSLNPPIPALAYLAAQERLAERIAAALLIGSILFFAALVTPIRLRRRREEQIECGLLEE